ncbi:3547_t:CDS:1, partial [Cetraspora pellucida]
IIFAGHIITTLAKDYTYNLAWTFWFVVFLVSTTNKILFTSHFRKRKEI